MDCLISVVMNIKLSEELNHFEKVRIPFTNGMNLFWTKLLQREVVLC